MCCQGHTLINEDFDEPQLEQKIAAVLAHLHSLDAPITKKVLDVLDVCLTFANQYESDVKPHLSRELITKFNSVFNFDWIHEVQWLQKLRRVIKTRVVFSHDMNTANALITEPDRNVLLLDYEFAAYTCRGYDLANHLNQRMYSPKLPEQNFITGMPPPTEHEKELFVKAYLTEFQRRIDKFDDDLDTFDNVMLDVEFGQLVYAIMFTVMFINRKHEIFQWRALYGNAYQVSVRSRSNQLVLCNKL